MASKEELRRIGVTLDTLAAVGAAAGMTLGELSKLSVDQVLTLIGSRDVAKLTTDFVVGFESPVVDVRAGLLELARSDFPTFVEYVARDEETGARIVLRPMHVEMLDASETCDALAVMAHPESGKTSLLVVMRALWILGRNPNRRIALVNNVREGAKKNLGAIVSYIEKSTALHEVFPDLVAAPGGTWTTETIVVKRPSISMKDPSIQTLGVHGSIQGSRVDDVLADDVLDFENTRTKALRDDTSKWFRSQILARSRTCVFLVNAWHPEDLTQELVKQRGFRLLTYPLYDTAGTCTWPERWTGPRIAEMKERIGGLEFTRLFLCKPRDEGAQVFTPESLARCRKIGRGRGLVSFLDPDEVPADVIVVTGVDLAVTKRMKGGETACVTLFVHPNERKQIIGCRGGRWGARAILNNLAAVGDAYGGVIVVEDNGAQAYLLEIAQELDEEIAVPVLAHTTGRNKIDPIMGVDSMAADFDAGRFVVPSGWDDQPHPQVLKLLNQLEIYDSSSHPGDYLMALWMARTYANRILRRRKRSSAGGGDVHVSVYG